MAAVPTVPTGHLDLYEPLEVIGNGSFGIIRKVRRKSDGEILARKELNFERMSERDRKQIVAEVNILKDLHHDNIVKYIDRFVDREAGILYILMEYCDGGDLSSIIKQCTRSGRSLPEDTVWSYFYQLLMALHHCHNPNSGSDGSESKRQQILHRDLKPENVFISNNGGSTVKLGDFGLSKALNQTSFAMTYVGTPYYMSPELIQEKSYDTKSDIWSLGCLIYELCAHKPPFAEAQTHSELSMLIRNGRIPPLPKGYSHALSNVIKAMLNLNPAMRPSASQLLSHERIEFARKVCDTEKLLATVKLHKANVAIKEKELQTYAISLAQREATLTDVIAQKDAEIQRLSTLVGQSDLRIKQAVRAREEELSALVMRREDEVRAAMTRREEEILEAVRKREDEINDAWTKREDAMRVELTDAVKWIEVRQKELTDEADRIEEAKRKLEEEAELLTRSQREAAKEKKTPLEEVRNLILPYSRIAYQEAEDYENTPRKPLNNMHRARSLDTPIAMKCDTTLGLFSGVPGSAMRGVVLTESGETLATPAPFSKTNVALTKIIKESPCVDLKFRKLFDFTEPETDEESGEVDDDLDDVSASGTVATSRSGSGSSTASERERQVPLELNSPTKHIKSRAKPKEKETEKPEASSSSSDAPKSRAKTSSSIDKLPPSKSKRQSLASENKLVPASRPSQGILTRVSRTSTQNAARRPTIQSTTSSISVTSSASSELGPTFKVPVATRKAPLPPPLRYDPSDEENLPSPFLRRIERKTARVSASGIPIVPSTTAVAAAARRKSNQNPLLRAAATNSAKDLQSTALPPSSTTVKASS